MLNKSSFLQGMETNFSLTGLLLIILIQRCFAYPKIQSSQKSRAELSTGESSVELLAWGSDTIYLGSRKDIHLVNYPPKYSAVVLIVNQVEWTDHELKNMSGDFSVIAPPGQGLMAVVQVLHLRSNPMNNHCIDYVQFYDPVSAVGSTKICGKLSKENKEYLPNEILGPRVFDSPNGMLQVQYTSDKGDPTFPTDKKYNVSFHMVEIVFTSYQDCDKSSEAEVKCGDNCIPSTVLCDERINCGTEVDFAIDEIKCSGYENNSEHHRSSFVISIYLGTALFFAFIFILAFYNNYKVYQRIQNIPHK